MGVVGVSSLSLAAGGVPEGTGLESPAKCSPGEGDSSYSGGALTGTMAVSVSLPGSVGVPVLEPLGTGVS